MKKKLDNQEQKKQELLSTMELHSQSEIKTSSENKMGVIPQSGFVIDQIEFGKLMQGNKESMNKNANETANVREEERYLPNGERRASYYHPNAPFGRK